MRKAETHSFNVEVACVVGANAAVIYNHIAFWCRTNRANGIEDAYADGHWWTRMTMSDTTKMYPYMTDRQLRYAVKKLIDSGLVIEANGSEIGKRHGKWYRIADDAELEPAEKPKKVKVSSKYESECYEVIEYLRQASGRKVEHCESNYKYIRSLLSGKNPATVEQMKMVISVKSKEWRNDPHFRQYLQPSTLFSKKHFKDYLLVAQESNARAERFDEDEWHGGF